MDWPGCLRLLMRFCRLRILFVLLVPHLAWWVEDAISHEPTDSYWDCGNQEGMESRADDVESQCVGTARGADKKRGKKTAEEGDEGNTGWVPDSNSNSNSGYPSDKHATQLPRPSTAPQGPLTSSPVTLNLRPPHRPLPPEIPTQHPTQPCSRGTQAISGCRSAQRTPPTTRKVRPQTCT